jgi:hypothetical protein
VMDAKTNKMFIAVFYKCCDNLWHEKVFLSKDAASNRFNKVGFGHLATGFMCHCNVGSMSLWLCVRWICMYISMEIYIALYQQVKFANNDRPTSRGTSGDLMIGENAILPHGYLSLANNFQLWPHNKKEVKLILLCKRPVTQTHGCQFRVR